MRHVYPIGYWEDRTGMSNGRLGRPAKSSQIRRIQWLTAAVAAIGAISPRSQPAASAASTDSWINASSNWNNPANWSLGAVPGTLGPVNISDDDTLNRTITYDYSGPMVTLSTLTIVNTGGGTNTLVMGSSSPALLTDAEFIGNSSNVTGADGAGVLSQASGVNTVIQSLYLGENATDAGTYALSGGIFNVQNGSEYVGYGGSGLVNQTGGDAQGSSSSGDNSTIYIGYNSGSSGIYDLSSDSLSVGGNDNGTPNGNIEVGYNIGAVGSLVLGAGNPTLSTSNGTVIVGYAGSGSFMQESGTTQLGSLQIGGPLFGGGSSPGSGEFNMSGGTILISTSGWYVGNNQGSIGSCTLSGGYVENTSPFTGQQTYGGPSEFLGLSVGAVTGGTGFFVQTGGTINNSSTSTTIGAEGFGTYNQTGGANLTYSFYVGPETNSNGTYNLSGTGVLATTGPEFIGGMSNSSGGESATFNQSGGTNTAGTLSIMGVGMYSQSAGTLTVAGTLSIGQYSGTVSSAMIQSGGSASAAALFVGGQPGSSSSLGAYDLSGTAALTVSGEEYIGGPGTGTFQQSGGSNATGTLSIGSQNSEGQATYLLSGGTLAVAGTETIAPSGTGSMIQSGGSNSAARLVVGYQDGNGSYTLSGAGTLTVSGNEYVGYEIGGNFVQNGGTNATSSGGNLYIGYDNDNNNGTYRLAAGTLSVAGGINIGSNTGDAFTITGGTATAASMANAGTFAMSNGTLTVPGLITNGFHEPFTLTGGSVTADSFSNTGTLSITNEGSLTLTDSFAQNSSGTLALGIVSTTEFNQIQDDGTVSLAGALDLLLASSYSPQLGDTFPIIDGPGGNVTGTFASIVQSISYGNGHFIAEYEPSGNPDGVDVVFVPEPVCVAPIALGAAALLRRRRAKRK
jgi:hypothetical protein